MQIFDWNAGKTFSRLMLTGKSYPKNRKRYVETICECGATKWIRFDSIKSGAISSCGCYHSECARTQFLTHGLSYHPLYSVHTDIVQRCYNEQCEGFEDYGKRGICMDEEWRFNFQSFYDWSMNNGWKKGCNLTLDRIDNDGNYVPSNCRYTNQYIQSRNKRSTVNLEIFGEVKCLTDWVSDSRCKVELNTFATRRRRGWNIEEALTTPSKIPENKNKAKRLLP